MNGLFVIRICRNSVYGCERRTEYGHTLTEAEIGIFFPHLNSLSTKNLQQKKNTRKIKWFSELKVLSNLDICYWIRTLIVKLNKLSGNLCVGVVQNLMKIKT